jgi:hypothetical protein
MSEMIDQQAGDQNLGLDGLPRLAELPIWQLVTAASLAFLNASWGRVAFRVIGVDNQVASGSTALIFLASSILITYLTMIACNALRLKGQLKNILAAGWLTLLIIYLPSILYSHMPAGIFSNLNRYLSAVFQLDFMFSPEFLSTVLIVYFWRLGLTLSNHWMGPLFVSRNLRVGTLLMLILGFAAASMGFVIPVAELFVLLFFGLSAMGSARISSVGFLRGGRRIPFSRSSLIFLILLAAGLTWLVLILTSVASSPIAMILNSLVWVIGISLSWIVVIIFGPIFIIILEFVQRFLERMKPFAETVETEIAPVITDIQSIMQEAADETKPFPFADQLSDILEILIPVLGISVLLFFGYLALRRTRSSHLWEDMQTEERELSNGSLLDYLRSLLRRGARSGLEAISNLTPISRVLAAAKVRQIYRQLLRESAKLGKSRKDAETPLEFLPELEAVFPGCREALELITRAYLRVRYGEYPETRGEVDEVELAWRRVRRSGEPLPVAEHQPEIG